jgi:hypothetical protein
MTIRKLMLFAAMLLMVGVPAAQADTLVLPAIDFAIPPGLLAIDFPVYVNVPLFNPALGTLNKVTLTLDTYTRARLQATEQLGRTTGSVTSLSGTTTVQASAFAGQLTATATAITTATGLPQPIGANANYNYNPATYVKAGDTKSISNPPNSLSSWIAPPATAINAIQLDVIGNGATGNCAGTVCGFVSFPEIYGSVQVTYDYTSPVPEPMSIILVGGSLLGLSVVMRRRTAKR